MFTKNENELIRKAKDNSNTAFNMLHEKYINFIRKKIHCFRIYKTEQEEFLQEGLMCLMSAVRTYDLDKDVPFINYFNMIINRKFIRILNLETKLSNVSLQLKEIHQREYVDNCFTEYDYEIQDELETIIFLTDEFIPLYKYVFKSYFLENMSLQFIADSLNLDIRRVYNVVARIKEKLRQSYFELISL